MALATYLNFDGNTREVVAYYAAVFDVDPGQLMTFGEFMPDSPEFQIPEEAKDRIMHAELRINGDWLMISDTFPGMPPLTVGNNFSITYLGDDKAKIESLFATLSADGMVDMPLAASSWSELYGQVTDKYGVSWQFNLDPRYA